MKVELCKLAHLIEREDGVDTPPYQGNEKGDPCIPRKYWSLKKVFNEQELDVLPPHHPTDCAIEILPWAKLSKPKMDSMTWRELDAFGEFIDKNLARGFIQPVKFCMTSPVLFF